MAQQEHAKARTLAKVVANLKAANAIGHRNLTLVPLWGEGHRRLDYLLAAEAISSGKLTITEVDESGSVPELLAVNGSEKMILLLDGEELVGAKQNRIMNTTVLLRPKSRTKIPVSCVEQGRWHHTSEAFSSGNYSPSKLRANKSRNVTANLRQCGSADSDQCEVWDDVVACLAESCVDSPTMAMREVVDKRRDSLDVYVNALAYPTAARGVIVAINGTFVAADVFDKPETLHCIWPRLITGYAMDAINQPTSGKRSRGKGGKTFSIKAADVLLEHIGQIECTPCPSVGMGKDWRFEAADIVGQALLVNRVCVHLCVFPNDDHHDRELDELHDSRISPPSHRRRGRFSG